MADTYFCGATAITLNALGSSQFPFQVVPPSGCVGMDLGWTSGGSAMILPNMVSGKTISGATSPASIPGYLIPTTYPYEIPGPAQFYLACGSSTAAVIGINFRFSAGGATLG